MAGMRLRYILGTIALFAAAAVSLVIISDYTREKFGTGIISEYQKNRVTAFLNPEEEKMGVSYQSYQSLAAIGSGRVFGRGVGNGIKTQFNQLPEKHTDFIIAVIAEEGGFLAVLVLLTAFCLFLFSAFMTAYNAPDQFGRLVVIGVIGIVSSQVIINIGVAVSLLPITGITLPFISYGGSSMMASFISIGVVMSIGREKKPYFT
jgi:rod shape determining protein RodA